MDTDDHETLDGIKEEEPQTRAAASASLLAPLSVYTSVLTTMAVTDRTDLLKPD